MTGENMIDTKQLTRLAERSASKNTYVYTDFLEEADQKIAIRIQKFVTLFGGADFAVRKIARFGNADEIGYEEDFPLRILAIKPLGGKFATPLTHRDILGALMNLGLAREKIGDIFAGETSYVVIYETLSAFVCDNLNKIGRNFVNVAEVSCLPDELRPETAEKSVSADSNRLDAIVCRVFNLSRETAQTLIADQLVKINGEIIAKSMRPLQQGDVVSVRGHGKFRFVGESGQSRKGKTYFMVEVFC
jgi:RNA-binding protein YlmH